MEAKNVVAIAAFAAALAGCAGNLWAPGPNAQGTFDEASAGCRIVASGDRTSVYAQGSPGYVAGAVTGAAIGDAVRQADDYNNCMLARGWVVVGKNDKATIEAQRSEAASLIAEIKQCYAGARNNPKYAIIVGYLSDENTRRYYLIQKANKHFATPAEGTALSSYSDEAAKCLDTHFDAMSRLDPRSAARARERETAGSKLHLLVIERKLNWGDYAQAAEALINDSQAGRPLPPPPSSSENAPG